MKLSEIKKINARHRRRVWWENKKEEVFCFCALFVGFVVWLCVYVVLAV